MTLADPLPDSLLSQTRALLRTRGLRPRRRRGQNFLVDPRVRDRIVAAAGIGPGSLVLEVGPGTGILTEAMLRAGASVMAVELDRDLAQALADRLGRDPALVVRVADALTFDFSEALRGDPRQGRIRVVANIPYYITTPLILRFLRHRELFDALFLTVQREVAERLTAAPGGKTYGALTLACRYWAECAFGAVHPAHRVLSGSRGGFGAGPVRSPGRPAGLGPGPGAALRRHPGRVRHPAQDPAERALPRRLAGGVGGCRARSGRDRGAAARGDVDAGGVRPTERGVAGDHGPRRRMSSAGPDRETGSSLDVAVG